METRVSKRSRKIRCALHVHARQRTSHRAATATLPRNGIRLDCLGQVLPSLLVQTLRDVTFAGSSIVMSKFLERHGERWIDGCRCLDLSAGCGLVAAVLSHQRPLCVMATDLPENLPLLQRNCQANAGAVEICVAAHVWGNTANAAPPFDLVVACDVMYDNANVTSLVSSLDAFMNDDGIALVCHGRNAHAEDAFLHRCQHHFVVSRLEWDAFDADFRSEEISCLILRRSVGQHTFENERAICLSSPH